MNSTSRGSGSSSNASQPNQSSSSLSAPSLSLENIKVAVRLRPFTEKEKQRNNKRIVDIEQNTVVLYTPKIKAANNDGQLKRFTFDYSYWSHDGFRKDSVSGLNIPDDSHQNANKYVGQGKVFEDLGQFLLCNAIRGYNSALLAYGQTGSGKSYTVSGYGQNEGILPRFARSLFEELDKKMGSTTTSQKEVESEETARNVSSTTLLDSSVNKEDQGEDPIQSESKSFAKGGNRYEVYFSMIEIYNEVVRDLLAKNHGDLLSQTSKARGLKVREHPKQGFFVENLSSYLCADKEEIEQRIEEGHLNKSIAATSMNETSSRGHTIYEFKIKQYKRSKQQSSELKSLIQTDLSNTSGETVTISVVQLVDLAGSERMAFHMNTPTNLLKPNLIPPSGGSSSAVITGSRSKSPGPRVGTGNSMLDGLATASTIKQTNSMRIPRPAAQKVSTQKQLRSALGTGSKYSNSASSSSSAAFNMSGNSPSPKRNVQHNISLNANLQQRFKESVSINQSLSALGNCIQVLSQYSQQLESSLASNPTPKGRPKIPYRDSVLTKLLNRCCLSGNSKVVIIATLSPADINYDDTLSTLRFADRAKQIRTHAIINRISSRDSELVGSLRRENDRLKQIVDNRGNVTRSDDSSQTSNFDENENIMENFTGSEINKQTGGGGARGRQQTKQQKSRIAIGSRVQALATPVRTKTSTIIKSKGSSNKVVSTKSTGNNKLSSRPNMISSISNPTLNGLDGITQNKAQNKLLSQLNNSSTKNEKLLKKSRSMGQGLAASGFEDDDYDEGDYEEDDDDAIELVRRHKNAAEIDDDSDDDDDDDDDVNIKEAIITPDSDSDSFAALADEELSQEERISIFNRLLSNSTVNNKFSFANKQSPNNQSSSSSNVTGRTKKMPRPKKISRIKAGVREVAMLSSSLKKTNPYLSNLNPDEQLSGMISYIIKVGETIVGKANDTDIMLHGPELRGYHAKITRDKQDNVYIEPIRQRNLTASKRSSGREASNSNEQQSNSNENQENNNGKTTDQNLALMVNGSPVLEKLKLNQCDRLLLGTNSYFVFANATQNAVNSSSGDTIANLDLVTYDMAKSEVMRKVMMEAKNEAMMREIRDYTHRPGTGKKASGERKSSLASKESLERKTPDKTLELGDEVPPSGGQEWPLPADRDDMSAAANETIARDISSGQKLLAHEPTEDKEETIERENAGEDNKAQEEINDSTISYQAQLMEDTYEYAMPVAEVNAVAKEMGIKVTYGLKILTGEEQLPQDQTNYFQIDSNASDESVSDTTDGETCGNNTTTTLNHQPNEILIGSVSKLIDSDKLTVLKELNDLDIPPALYIKVHLDEHDMNFYWSKEKFQARRDKILELYGAWDIGGKSSLVEYLIEQSKATSISSAATSRSSNYQGYYNDNSNYLFDPFIDDPQTSFVLIGNAQINLQPISHLSDIKHTYDLIDVNDENVGDISIEVVPCHSEPTKVSENNNNQSGNQNQDSYTNEEEIFLPFSEEELKERFLDEPEKILGQRLVIKFKILTCDRISSKFVNVFCQYTLKKDEGIIKTKLVRTFNFAGIGYDSNQHHQEQQQQQQQQPKSSDSGADSNNLGSANEQPEMGAPSQTDPNLSDMVCSASSSDETLNFQSSHYICFEEVDENILNFLRHGFLAIQVVGQYKQANCFTSTVRSPTVVSTIINSINKYKYKMQQVGSAQSNFNNPFSNNNSGQSGTASVYNFNGGGGGGDSAKSIARGAGGSGEPNSSRILNSNSGASSVVSTVNMFDQENQDEEGINSSMNGLSQENVIDMILTKRKLDRAQNQLHYLKRTINIAEHYNKKHIPVKTVKKLLNLYGREMENNSLEELTTNSVTNAKGKPENKHSGCSIQ